MTKVPKPWLVGPAELLNLRPAIGTAEHRRDGDDQNVDQQVT